MLRPSPIDDESGGGGQTIVVAKNKVKRKPSVIKKPSPAKKTIVKKETLSPKQNAKVEMVADNSEKFEDDDLATIFVGRSRREKEKNAFVALSSLLPLSPPIRDQLDKSGSIRVAIAYLKLQRLFRTMLSNNLPTAGTSQDSERVAVSKAGNNVQQFYALGANCPQQQQRSQSVIVANNSSRHKNLVTEQKTVEPMHQFAYNLFQAMDGFVIVIDSDGKVVYVSETVAVHLGLSQIELVGNALFEFLHPEDIPLLRDRLALGVACDALRVLEPTLRFTLRFRCAPGRRAMMGCSSGVLPGFKPCHFMGMLHADDDGRFVGYGQPSVAYGLNELRLSSSMFMFRATPSLQLIFVDNCFTMLTGFSADALLDNTLYSFIHPADVDQLREAHQTALLRGQSISAFYRLLGASGGCQWVQCRLCAVSSNRLPSLTQMIIGVCSLISGVEEANIVVDIKQTYGAKCTDSNKREECGGVLGFYSHKFYGNGVSLAQLELEKLAKK